MTDLHPELELACFRLGPLLLGIDIMRIREIIMPRDMEALPDPPSHVTGGMVLRGRLIPVVNLSNRFHLPPSTAERVRLVVVSLANCTVALQVDAALGVRRVAVDAIRPPPPVYHGVTGEFLLGICLQKGETIMVLDIDKLLSPEVSSRLPELSRGDGFQQQLNGAEVERITLLTDVKQD